MEGKVFGIPLVIIILALFIAALIDLPLVLLNAKTQDRLTKIEDAQVGSYFQVSEVQKILANPSPTATPTASITPTRVLYRVAQPVNPTVTAQ